jgi:tetratricopeptide (TPR) repeat protein
MNFAKQVWAKGKYLAPLVVFAGGYAFMEYCTSSYPSSAKKHLRRALLAHDYNIGNIHKAAEEYRHAYVETIKILGERSREAIGVLEKLSDLYKELGETEKYINTLSLLLGNLDQCKGFDGTESDSKCDSKKIQSFLKCAQKLADEYANNSEKSSYYYGLIVENSVVPHIRSESASSDTNSDSGTEIELRPWASATQVGSALEQIARIYTLNKMYGYAIPIYAKALEIMMIDKTLSQKELGMHSATLHNNLGDCFAQLGDYTNASKVIQIAVDVSFDSMDNEYDFKGGFENFVALYNLGTVYERLKQMHLAKECYTLGKIRGKMIGYDEGVIMCEKELNRIKIHGK